MQFMKCKKILRKVRCVLCCYAVRTAVAQYMPHFSAHYKARVTARAFFSSMRAACIVWKAGLPVPVLSCLRVPSVRLTRGHASLS